MIDLGELDGESGVRHELGVVRHVLPFRLGQSQINIFVLGYTPHVTVLNVSQPLDSGDSAFFGQKLNIAHSPLLRIEAPRLQKAVPSVVRIFRIPSNQTMQV